MALYGLRPCVEIQFADYMYPAYDQIVSEAARIRHRSAADFTVPLTIRMPTGGGIFGGQTHSQSPEALFTHVAGLKTVIPSTPYDAKGLLIAAIEDDDPVVFLEPKRLYNGPFDGHHERPIVPWSADARTTCPRATTGCRSARPASTDRGTTSRCSPTARSCTSRRPPPTRPASTPRSSTCGRSSRSTSTRSWRRSRKTGRCVVAHEATLTSGFGAELCAVLQERMFWSLEAPIARVAGWDTAVSPRAGVGLLPRPRPSGRRDGRDHGGLTCGASRDAPPGAAARCRRRRRRGRARPMARRRGRPGAGRHTGRRGDDRQGDRRALRGGRRHGGVPARRARRPDRGRLRADADRHRRQHGTHHRAGAAPGGSAQRPLRRPTRSSRMARRTQRRAVRPHPRRAVRPHHWRTVRPHHWRAVRPRPPRCGSTPETWASISGTSAARVPTGASCERTSMHTWPYRARPRPAPVTPPTRRRSSVCDAGSPSRCRPRRVGSRTSPTSKRSTSPSSSHSATRSTASPATNVRRSRRCRSSCVRWSEPCATTRSSTRPSTTSAACSPPTTRRTSASPRRPPPV